jgi:flagellar basal body-associated protein FliL
MSSNKNSIGTIILISCAVILVIVGLLYSFIGGAKADVVTKEQARKLVIYI